MDKEKRTTRRSFIRLMGSGLVAATPIVSLLSAVTACSRLEAGGEASGEDLFITSHFTEPGTFISGIDPPTVDGAAVDHDGNVYAVNYGRLHTIGKVTPEGEASLFVELPVGCLGSSIRFNSLGEMMVADRAGGNILKIDTATREVRIHAHDPRMHPGDLAIGANDVLYASDPDWDRASGRLWRIDTDGSVTLLAENLGTANGIEVGMDESKLYITESLQRNVWEFDLSAEGELSNKRLLTRFPDYGIDGMRTDVDGNLYVTRKGHGRTIVIFSKEGKQLREMTLRGGYVANSLTFGGPDGCTAYVTVADRGNIQMFRTDRPGRCWALSQRPPVSG